MALERHTAPGGAGRELDTAADLWHRRPPPGHTDKFPHLLRLHVPQLGRTFLKTEIASHLEESDSVGLEWSPDCVLFKLGELNNKSQLLSLALQPPLGDLPALIPTPSQEPWTPLDAPSLCPPASFACSSDSAFQMAFKLLTLGRALPLVHSFIQLLIKNVFIQLLYMPATGLGITVSNIQRYRENRESLPSRNTQYRGGGGRELALSRGL